MFTPTSVAPASSARSSSLSSCTSTSTSRPSACRRSHQPPHVGIAQGGDDQQHGVRAGGACLDELVLVDDEVLAEQRHRDGGPDCLEVRQVAVEERRLGEHRYRRGASALVAGRDGRRHVVLAKHAARRRSPLALRDHLQARRSEGVSEAARRASARWSAPRARLAGTAARRAATRVIVAATMAWSRSAVMPAAPLPR